MGLQLLWILLFTYLGNAFYFWINGAEKCVIVTSDTEDAARVAEALQDFGRRYDLLGICPYNSDKLEEMMLAADTIVLYEVPVDVRTGIVNFSYQNLKNVYFNPHIADILEQNSKRITVDDISFFASQFHTITFEQRIIKRLMDISISFTGLLLTSPLLLFAAIAIKRHGWKGPVQAEEGDRSRQGV